MTEERLFVIFPGQGAQAVGMGKSLAEHSPKARERFQEADEVLSLPLSSYCFDGPIEKLTETAITQPALLTVSVIAFELWAEKCGTSSIQAGAGHSLGEYSALVAAGAISFADALRVVHNRGKFMQEAVPMGEGSMIAVLGKELAEVEEALDGSAVEIANINAPGQIVLAGSATEVRAFSEKQTGWKIKELQVSAPFHCSLMKSAEQKLAPLVNDVAIAVPKFPIIQNVSAEPTTDPETIRRNLIDQVCGSVRWVDCVERAASQFGVTKAIEFGSGKVLSGLMRRIRKDLPTANISEIESIA
ncbi:MAG: ACP S-malonyltransferase [Bdellovibrionales bacterium]|nr:ACP S-malonyltransferase [Bdellovibrionales bacterium]